MDGSSYRVNKFLDILKDQAEEDDNILMVFHGIIMTISEEELVKRAS